jgi:hypothetical protein
MSAGRRSADRQRKKLAVQRITKLKGMADAIFTHPLLAEGLNTLFAMFDG